LQTQKSLDPIIFKEIIKIIKNIISN